MTYFVAEVPLRRLGTKYDLPIFAHNHQQG